VYNNVTLFALSHGEGRCRSGRDKMAVRVTDPVM
jgi:hypothetical protein